MMNDLYQALAQHLGMAHLNASEQGRVTLQFEDGVRVQLDPTKLGIQVSLLMTLDPVLRPKQLQQALVIPVGYDLSCYAVRPGLVGESYLAFHTILGESQMQLDCLLEVIDELRKHGQRVKEESQ